MVDWHNLVEGALTVISNELSRGFLLLGISFLDSTFSSLFVNSHLCDLNLLLLDCSLFSLSLDEWDKLFQLGLEVGNLTCSACKLYKTSVELVDFFIVLFSLFI